MMQAAVALCAALAAIVPMWGHAGTDAWALTAFYTLSGAAFLLSAAICPRSSGGIRIWMIPAIGFLLFGLMQAWNPSHVYSVGDGGLSALAHITQLPATVDRASSLRSVGHFAACIGLVFALSGLPSAQRRRLVLAVALSVSLMALYACAQRLSPARTSDLFGRFVNANSFAAYANLAMPVLVGLGRDIQRDATARGLRSHPGFLLYFCAFLCFLAVLLSGSRAGICIGLVLALVCTMATLRDLGGPRWRRLRRGTSVCVLLVGLGIAGLLARDTVLHELDDFSNRGAQSLVHRSELYASTLNMAREHLIFGVGLGGFHAAYPHYQAGEDRGYYRHAHCEPLQVLAETGVVGVILVVGLLVLLLRSRPNTVGMRVGDAEFGLRMALLGLLVHTLVDFPLRVPTVAAVAALWLGAISASAAKEPKGA